MKILIGGHPRLMSWTSHAKLLLFLSTKPDAEISTISKSIRLSILVSSGDMFRAPEGPIILVAWHSSPSGFEELEDPIEKVARCLGDCQHEFATPIRNISITL